MININSAVETEFLEVPSDPSDKWIFDGTYNDSDFIMEDRGGSMSSKWSDKFYSKKIKERLASAYPLRFGEIGIVAITEKFENDQLSRMMFESCSYSGKTMIPQLSAKGDVSIPSHYRIENISKYANISLKQASVISRIYCELGLTFKNVIKFNKAIRVRRVRNPWDIKINKDGLTLLECAKELKELRLEEDDYTELENNVNEFTYWNLSKVRV